VQNGQRLIVAMSGLKTARDRQIEAKKLMDWGFRSFEVKTILNAGAEVGSASVFGGSESSVALAPKVDVRLPVPRGAPERMTAKHRLSRGRSSPRSTQGTEVGTATWSSAAPRSVMEAPLLAVKDVPAGTLKERAADAALELGRAPAA
jgi:D-alanyl-D-alanine carboxypeptidase (penicillin-binding protein 5/6)